MHRFYIWYNRLLLVSAKHFKTKMPLHLWKHHSKKHIFSDICAITIEIQWSVDCEQ